MHKEKEFSSVFLQTTHMNWKEIEMLQTDILEHTLDVFGLIELLKEAVVAKKYSKGAFYKDHETIDFINAISGKFNELKNPQQSSHMSRNTP